MEINHYQVKKYLIEQGPSEIIDLVEKATDYQGKKAIVSELAKGLTNDDILGLYFERFPTALPAITDGQPMSIIEEGQIKEFFESLGVGNVY